MSIPRSNRDGGHLRWCLALALLVIAACGGPTTYRIGRSAAQASPVAADETRAPEIADLGGLVTVEPVEGTLHLVTVSLDALPPPSRLDPSLRAYVVWFEGSHGSVRAGELVYDRSAREGRMHATTPLRRFTLQITAERDPRAATPSDHVVVHQPVGES